MSSEVGAEPPDDEVWLGLLISALENHARGLRGACAPGPLTAQVEETHLMAVDLLAAFQEGLDQPEDWDRLSAQRDSLGKAMSDYGERRWVALGPTNSHRLNRYFHFFDSLESAETQRSLSLLSEDLLVAGRGLLPEAAPLLSLLRAIPPRLEDGDVAACQALARDAFEVLLQLEGQHDLAIFDRPLELDWVEGFFRLARAVADGVSEVEALLDARDRMLFKVAGLVENCRHNSPEPDPTPLLASLAEHLSVLDDHLQTDQDFELWGHDLRAQWSELEGLVASFSQGRTRCPVCSATIAPGSIRCGGCRTLL